MPWKWRYIGRVAPQGSPPFEFGIRANTFDEAEALARRWAIVEGLGSADLEVRPATPDDKPPGRELQRRLGRLTRPVIDYATSEVPSRGFDEFRGARLYREPPASPSLLANAERRLGLPLPTALQEFLLWSNGGQTTDGVVLLPADRLYLFDDLDFATEEHEWLLAIGTDDAGDVVCLAPNGQVLLGSHDPPGVQAQAADFGVWLRAPERS